MKMYNSNFDNGMGPGMPTDYFGEGINNPYIRNVTTRAPQPMAGNLTEDTLFPLQSALTTPQFNSTAPQANTGYARGGRVKPACIDFAKGGSVNNNLPSLAEMVRQQGNPEDSILAHINPMEAQLLKSIGGSGTINPRTGLPQFGFFKNPLKWIKSVAGPVAGVVLGNALLPGIGGILGGAAGGAAGSAVRGRKDFGKAALRGGLMGMAAPTAASLAGGAANSMGMGGLGASLSNYGNTNAILPALGLGGLAGSNSIMPGPLGAMGLNSAMGGAPQGGMPTALAMQAEGWQPQDIQAMRAAGANSNMGFLDKLMGNTSNFLSQPSNLLALASAAGSIANRPKAPKEKTPEQLAEEIKRYNVAMRLSPSERAAMEADLLSQKQMERRIEMNKYLPEERFAVNKTHRKVNSPKDYKKKGRWLEYYDNPQFMGNPLMMKKGGNVPMMEVDEIDVMTPDETYVDGNSGGQEDAINALVSAGEYVIPADVVSHLGDGNNSAGAKKFDEFMNKIRKHKTGREQFPPKAKTIEQYMR